MHKSDQSPQRVDTNAPVMTGRQRMSGISRYRRVLHWTTALLVLILIAVGKWISDLELTDLQLLRESLWKFSLHKTLGLVALVITLARFAAMWAGNGFTHSAHNRYEVLAASAVQTYFLCALLLLPLSGLVMHGFAGATAPIWIVPEGWLHASRARPEWVEMAVSVHHLIANGLLVALILHVAGVVKHHFIDRDQTLVRMWAGQSSELLPSAVKLDEADRSSRHGKWVGIVLAGLAITIGMWTAGAHEVQKAFDLQKSGSNNPAQDASNTSQATFRSSIDNSVLSIFATQGSSPFEAKFSRFEVVVTEAENQLPITIDVVIDSGSFESGASDRDKVVAGRDWLDFSTYPTTNWQTDSIERQDDGFSAEGKLTVRKVSAPVSIQFDYQVSAANPDNRTLAGSASFDRFALELGRGDYAAESSAGKNIRIEFEIELARE